MILDMKPTPLALQYRKAVAQEVRVAMVRHDPPINQTELAKLINLSQPQISGRLRGTIPFTTDDLCIVADVLDVPISTFIVELDAAGLVIQRYPVDELALAS